ncbi:hypothetical protein Cni_G15805 [Canna indica]|uniref:Thaumatin-like protein n=1 Tax=Canna indica TaxID=4628 RepID=A0AAQ3KEZ9_9LILI|nr:hypothetical protein Cni_G15805 [Canna indica]
MPQLSTTGFELATGAQQSFDVPAKWSGRVWARTNCTADSSGKLSCLTADCASSIVPCNGAGGVPPATLTEFTVQGHEGMDFFDVSNVDGFNLPVAVVPQGGSGTNCNTTACPVDINKLCPAELQKTAAGGAVVGCKSACLAFNTDEYCCRGAYGSPTTCKASQFAKVFKDACPQAYSYAYDDSTSTFTCTGANYSITFCP